MKEPISIDKDKILAIVRDRKSQKIAVATIATATALIFSIVNLPVLKSHEEPAMKSMSIEAPHQVKSVLNDKSVMTDEDSKDLDKKEDKKEETKKEDKKEDKKEEAKKEDKKDETKKEEPKKEETKKEDTKKSESKSTSSSSSQSTARQNSSNASQSQSNASQSQSNASQSQSSDAPAKSGSSVAATVPKIEIPKLKPRVNADEMNRNDKPSNWDGSKEVDEASVDDQWNDDDAIDEIDAR